MLLLQSLTGHTCPAPCTPQLESHALFYTQLLQQQRKTRRKTDVDFVLRSNQRILEAIREMVYDTRYPAQRDRVRGFLRSPRPVEAFTDAAAWHVCAWGRCGTSRTV